MFEKFADLDEESFEAIVSLAALTKKPHTGMAPVENDKNNTPVKTVKAEEETEASEEAEEAQATEADIDSLEEAEATEETPDVTVGSTSEEDEQSSIRAELVEFVSARLNK